MLKEKTSQRRILKNDNGLVKDIIIRIQALKPEYKEEITSLAKSASEIDLVTYYFFTFNEGAEDTMIYGKIKAQNKFGNNLESILKMMYESIENVSSVEVEDLAVINNRMNNSNKLVNKKMVNNNSTNNNSIDNNTEDKLTNNSVDNSMNNNEASSGNTLKINKDNSSKKVVVQKVNLSKDKESSKQSYKVKLESQEFKTTPEADINQYLNIALANIDRKRSLVEVLIKENKPAAFTPDVIGKTIPHYRAYKREENGKVFLITDEIIYDNRTEFISKLCNGCNQPLSQFKDEFKKTYTKKEFCTACDKGPWRKEYKSKVVATFDKNQKTMINKTMEKINRQAQEQSNLSYLQYKQIQDLKTVINEAKSTETNFLKDYVDNKYSHPFSYVEIRLDRHNDNKVFVKIEVIKKNNYRSVLSETVKSYDETIDYTITDKKSYFIAEDILLNNYKNIRKALKDAKATSDEFNDLQEVNTQAKDRVRKDNLDLI